MDRTVEFGAQSNPVKSFSVTSSNSFPTDARPVRPSARSLRRIDQSMAIFYSEIIESIAYTQLDDVEAVKGLLFFQ